MINVDICLFLQYLIDMASGGSHLCRGRLKMLSVREAARADLRELLGSSSIKKVINV